ncbi:MAG TPA: M20 family metallo-hydrolase [Steroidobacteraceae bacterium]|nr:M20 family metallo-hydrolase [Steroidobacteraceae bacterium]
MTLPASINRARLLDRIERLAAVNRLDDSSCCRLALTDADREGRDLVVGWMKDAGLHVQIDRIGNIIGVRSDGADAAPVMTGSHIDTVATGGRFDGAYGVIAGIEALQTLHEAGVATHRGLAVAAFTNEEGARFQPDMMGSLVYAGGLSLSSALASTADDGATLGQELERIGYAGTLACGAIRPHAYVELHIEQGPVLDREGGTLGAVQDLQGISWQELTIRGVSNHAGTTPMRLRHDAGYCAARVAVFVRELAQRFGGSQVATVGRIQLKPNLVNVIAREARLTVDLRNTNDELLDEAEAQLARFLQELTSSEGVTVETRRLARTPAVRFDERVVQIIEDVAAQMGHADIRRMTSGAGHDAQMMARICPAAMIFVPSIRGISHNPAELTEPDHLELGANLLTRVIERIASE